MIATTVYLLPSRRSLDDLCLSCPFALFPDFFYPSFPPFIKIAETRTAIKGQGSFSTAHTHLRYQARFICAPSTTFFFFFILVLFFFAISLLKVRT